VKNAIKIFAVLGVNLLTFELLCTVVVSSGLLSTSFPTYELQNRRFFGDYNRDFGAWHLPGTSFRHKTKCFNAIYEFNSVGAKDTEFNQKNSQKDIFLIGDSMAEGFGLSNNDSLDSQLEAISEMNVLNFGTSGHFGTTQYSLLYEHFQARFKHERLIILLTLQNDFLDDSFEFGREVFHQRYRPYHVSVPNKQGEYSLKYFDTKKLETGELELKDIFSAYLASYHVAKFIYKTGKTAIYEEFSKQSRSDIPIFDEAFFNESMDLMVYNLNSISKKASEISVEVFVVIVPSSADVISGVQTFQTKKVKTELEKRVNKVEIIDPFHVFRDHHDPKMLFHSCDQHLSPEGAKTLAQVLNRYLS